MDEADPIPVQGEMFEGVPRPREGDPDMVGEAAMAIERAMRRRNPGYMKGIPEGDFALHLASAYPFEDEEGLGIAKEMDRRHSYDIDPIAVEVYDGWSEELRAIRNARIKAWIAATGPVPPFEGIARVRIVSGHPTGEGVAYRDERQDALAECLFVPDGERRGGFLNGNAFTGGYVVAWESVEVVGEAGEEDRALFAGRRADHERLARHRAFQVEVERRYRDAVDDARPDLEAMGDDDLKEHAAALVGELSDAVGAPGFDPYGELPAKVVAALDELRTRHKREACKDPAGA